MGGKRTLGYRRSPGGRSTSAGELILVTLYLCAALAAAIAYLMAARFRRGTRIAIALLVFVVPCAALTAWIFEVGDKAPSDAVTVRSQ
jgi:hypothetical protein